MKLFPLFILKRSIPVKIEYVLYNTYCDEGITQGILGKKKKQSQSLDTFVVLLFIILLLLYFHFLFFYFLFSYQSLTLKSMAYLTILQGILG